jgi:hypothetical protein
VILNARRVPHTLPQVDRRAPARAMTPGRNRASPRSGIRAGNDARDCSLRAAASCLGGGCGGLCGAGRIAVIAARPDA